MNVILLGAPGSGKGTQSTFIAEKYYIAHISTGDILRASVKEGSLLGKEAKAYMEKGELVPDSLIVNLIENRIKNADCKQGFLLDGFPRTTMQADALANMLDKTKSKIDFVIQIDVPKDELIKRLLSRAEKEGRSDDNEKAITNRLKVYNEQTKPLIDYYNAKGVLFGVVGLGSVDSIKDRIAKVLN